MIACQSFGQGVLIDNFAARDIHQDAARLHRCEARVREQAIRLRRPLAADRHDIAVRQKPVQLSRAGNSAETRLQAAVWRWAAAGADNMHAERGTQPPDLLPDAAGANNADGLAL